MNKRDLKKLKKKLPRGYRKLISEKEGCSISAIDAVLRGDYENEKILGACIALASAKQEKIKEYSNRINSL